MTDERTPTTRQSARARNVLIFSTRLLVAALAVALNIWLFADALQFELGEHLAPSCRAFAAAIGVGVVTAAFVAQAASLAVAVAVWRSWIWAFVLLVPFWALVYAFLCTSPF